MSVLPLRLAGATLRRRGKALVGPVDWTLDGDGITCVIGPNGAGKTSLLRMMHGLQPLAAGTLEWAAPLARARRAQAFVFQRPIMLRRSVLQNLAFPLRVAGIPRREARARAEDQARAFGLAPLAQQHAPSLSGGEMQRLALARALIGRPQVLFADEPTAALDGAATREIEARLREAAAAGTRVVMSTHDMGQARRLAREVVMLYRGRVHEAGPDVLTAPRTPEAAAFLQGDIVE